MILHYNKSNRFVATALNIAIGAVWLVNGLYCKLLNFVPRHQQIVARILGNEHAVLLTKTIGVLEIMMAIWVVSRIFSKWCTALQILLGLTMNVIEYTLAPDLLLFGRLNLFIAMLFIVVLLFNGALYNRRNSSPTFKI